MALNILLVDDDTDFAELTAKSLRGEGHRVSIAKDGTTATMLARELRPEVVLLDLQLPDGDGYEVARALRGVLPQTTPIIVVTGMRDANLVDEVDLMLHKPIPTELFGGLLEYMRRSRQNKANMRRIR